MDYYHFCRNDRKLGYGDGRQIRTGQTLKVNCEPVLCQKGLHASKRPIDALGYAQGDIICIVKLGGKIVHGRDKSVATERTVVKMFNGEKLLHEFACQCAERALKKAKVKDPRCWDAIKAKRDWLKGKITDSELAAAWDAARAAARAAARDAVWDAASAAASAAWDAASAAWDAARAAAWGAAWGAARDAEIRRQNKELSKMIKEKFRNKRMLNWWS